MKFHIKKSRFSVKSQFKEQKCAEDPACGQSPNGNNNLSHFFSNLTYQDYHTMIFEIVSGLLVSFYTLFKGGNLAWKWNNKRMLKKASIEELDCDIEEDLEAAIDHMEMELKELKKKKDGKK